MRHFLNHAPCNLTYTKDDHIWIDFALRTMPGQSMRSIKQFLRAKYGENRQITDDNYDKSLAVKCINGTFVGRKTDGVIAYKGIPFVGAQPVGDLRWKAPVDYTADDGVYEAYYIAKSPRQHETLDEEASLYVQGEDCLNLNIWKAEDAGDEKKPVMVWIHGGAFELGGTMILFVLIFLSSIFVWLFLRLVVVCYAMIIAG